MFLLVPLTGVDGVVAEGRETVQDVQPSHAELGEHSLALLGQQLGQAEAGLEGAVRSEEEKVWVKCWLGLTSPRLEVQGPALPAVVEAQHGGHQVEGDVQRHYLQVQGYWGAGGEGGRGGHLVGHGVWPVVYQCTGGVDWRR